MAALAANVAADRRTLADLDPSLLGHLHHRALLGLAAGASAQPDAAVERLRALARTVLPEDAAAPLWYTLPLLDRVRLWVLAHGTTVDLLEVLASQYEDTTAVPLTLGKGDLRADPPVLERITPMPACLCAVTEADLSIRQVLRECSWLDADRLVLDGWAYVPGLGPDALLAPEIVLLPADKDVAPETVVGACVERVEAPLADLDADDPWRTYTGSGYRAVLDLAGLPARPLRAQLRIRAGEALLAQPIPPPLGSRRLCPSPAGWSVDVDGEALLIRPTLPRESVAGSADPNLHPTGMVVVDAAALDGDRLVLSGSIPRDAGLAVEAVSSRVDIPLVTTVTAEGWAAILDLADPTFPSGGYFLRWTMADATGRCIAGVDLDGPPTELAGHARRVRLRPQPDGSLDLSIIAPVAPQHRSLYARRLLIEEDWGPLVPGIFFETFSGKSVGDNPGAIRDELIRRGTQVPLWVSVRDGTVPVAAGATPVVVGTPEWFRALHTAQLLVINDNLPHWFAKRPDQTILQTWHGTPIKHLLADAPRKSITLPYWRLMARQVPQWDLLLAQTPDAADDLRHGLGYAGPVLIGEQPRNAGLLGGATTARSIRRELGISEDEAVILYAPTWREGLRQPQGDAPVLLDVGALARATGAVVLLRSHHMNALQDTSERVLDVSRHPSIEALMLASDLLITDYSSVVFDWALTGRPAVLHVPDLEAYRDRERGFYRDWPGDSGLPVTRTQAEAEARAAELLASGKQPQVDGGPIRESLDAICAWVDMVLSGLPGVAPARTGEEEPP
ncbi:CDP-glycerol glycerophosphotransferase family protein [Actinomyces ruminicola]|uniref:CDP-glycerol glycerophosphotransferase, TagB/SpsB family n=1 Tax=Actinomyces ruminicola TaxID=332524 RepID=A0A1G9YD34_9ACTO|nr:CDP-glycerol glycerophosphotransferase family protein [Actinomyces ruminicola]SDN06313.1 CDP-glycerol glycerophosphotransferase, TagB/SpsB family [Actinomyces ruminicola]